MSENTYLIFSNRYQKLADALALRLYSTSPLLKRFVVVEKSDVKDWLMLYFANHPNIEIAAGMHFLSLEEMLLHFSEGRNYPNRIEIFLALIQEIETLLKEPSSDERELFQPFFDYLPKDFATGRKKLQSLAFAISSFLSDFGFYKEEEEKSWQRELWKRIYTKKNWLTPLQILEEPSCVKECEIHLFDLDFLPEFYVEFFEKVSKKNPVHYYLLSPCQEYWADALSDKELKVLERSFQRKGRSLEELAAFEERHTLLANFGRLQRRFLQILDEYDFHVEEYYYSTDTEKDSLLAHVQNDLLHQICRKEKESLLKTDNSVQIHLAGSSQIRELEILHDRLLALYFEEEKRGGTITASDILVAAPDIESYIPFIHLVFGGRPSPFDYKIIGESSLAQNDLLQGFIHLLSLTEKEGEIEEIKKLWDNRFFQKRYDLNSEDVEIFKGWIFQANTRFGLTESSSSFHSWDYALSRLLSGLLFEYDEALPAFPLEGIDLTQYDRLDKFFRVLELLKNDLSYLKKNPKETLSQWASFLENLLKNYFAWEREERGYFQDIEEITTLLRRGALSFKEEFFDFFTLFAVLKKESEKKRRNFQGSFQNAIRFTSLKKGSILPSKVLCLIGFEEDAFPRYSPPISFNPLQHKSIKKQEEDRTLFLRALLLTERSLLISYKNFSSEDGKAQNSSLFLQEFAAYLNENYGYNGKKIAETLTHKHPALPFHASLFDGKNTHIQSYNHSFFRAAQRHSQKERERLLFPAPSKTDSSACLCVDLKDLLKLSKDPWKFYLNKTLSIYLEKNESEGFLKEEFFLSKLDEYSLKKSSLSKSWKEVLEDREKMGVLPLSLFGESAKSKMKEEMSSWYSDIQELGLKKEDIFSLRFSESVREMKMKSEKQLLLPPLKIPFQERTISLVGEIPFMTKSGILLLQENKLEKIFQNWPLLLVYSLLPSNLKPENATIYFSKNPSKIDFQMEDAREALSQYLSYFFHAEESLSPFRPDWIEGFLKKDETLLQKKMSETIKGNDYFRDLYSDWLLKDRVLPSSNLLLSSWGSYFDRVFAPFNTLVEK